MKRQKIKNLVAMGLIMAVSSGFVACGEKTEAEPLKPEDSNDKNKLDVATNKEQEIFTEDKAEAAKENKEKTESITGKYCSYMLTTYNDAKSGQITNIDSFLNVRNEPSLLAESVGRLANNAEVKVVGITGDWYQIEAEGIKGFVHANYTKVEGLAYNYTGDVTAPTKYTVSSSTTRNDYYTKPSTGNNVVVSNPVAVKPNKPSVKPSTPVQSEKPSVKPSVPSVPSVKPSVPSVKPTTPEKPSIKPSTPSIKPDAPTTPEKPSVPSVPTTPEKPSVPSTPVTPEKPSIPGAVINAAPVITGENICYIFLNKEFKIDYLKLKAMDVEDGDITDKIVVIKNDVDTSKRGIYEVVVEVTDSQGATTRATFTVDTTKSIDDTDVDNGNNGGGSTENTAPVIVGDSITIEQGSTFDVSMLDIKVYDAEDGELPYEVESNNVNVDEPGTYTVVVKATDSKGLVSTQRFAVTVVAKEPSTPDTPDVEVNTPPVINVKNQQVTLKEGEKWSLDLHGVTATDAEDGDIKEIKVNGTVDTSVAGTKFVEISVTDSKGETVKTTLTVVVVKKASILNSAPTMTVAKEEVTLTQGESWNVGLHGVTANDTEDGELKVLVDGTVDTSVVGTHKVVVYAVDTNGAKVTRQLTVVVNAKKNSVPVVTAHDITINKGEKYDVSKHEAQATDAEDGPITNKITYKTNVDTSRVGVYETTFSVQDSAGVTSSITVKVEVLAVNPTITCNENITINQNESFDKSMIKATAKDANGIDISGSIEYRGLNNVNTSVPGTYQVTVVATDADGLQASKTVTITVNEVVVEEEGMSVFSPKFKQILTDEMNKLVNAHRAANGKAAFDINDKAQECATVKSKHMADNNYFDHDFNGDHIWDIYEEYSNIGICAENIFKGSINVAREFTEQETRAFAARIFKAWKNSAGHNANMLDSWSDAYGFGFYITETGTLYATQIFVAY